jgi:hypothetical protein
MSSTSAEEEKPRRKRAVRGSVKDAEEAPKKKAKAKPKKKVVSDDDGEESPSKEDKKPRKKAADHQVLTEREELPKLWNAKEHEETSHSKLLWHVVVKLSKPGKLKTHLSSHSAQDLFMECGRSSSLAPQSSRNLAESRQGT